MKFWLLLLKEHEHKMLCDYSGERKEAQPCVMLMNCLML